MKNHLIYNKCCQCGECCGRFLPLSKQDIKKIRKYLIKYPQIKTNSALQIINDVVTEEMLEDPCPFLDNTKKDKKCMIYPARPIICRVFVCKNSVLFGTRALINNHRINDFQPVDMYSVINQINLASN